MNWYLEVLRKYAVFSGRARRKEYWFFVLFNTLVVMGIGIVEVSTGLYREDMGYGPLSSLYSLAVLLPSLAVWVRRLHDTGRSAWWILISLVPLIGAVVLFVFSVLDSDPGANDYGPNPKGLEA